MLVKQIFDLIHRIREQGMAILLVEQNARAALSVADYGYILDAGRIVLEGSSEELRADERVEAAYLGGHVT
jgi:branched-chain amino acid transport system ATP-binding protein